MAFDLMDRTDMAGAQEYGAFGMNLEHPAHRAFYDYWHRIGPDYGLPSRQDVDPISIPQFLAWMLLLDVVSGESGDGGESGPRFRIRLMGTMVVDRSGADSTGRWLDEAVSESQLKILAGELSRAVSTKSPVRYVKHSIIEGREHVAIDTLALPLAADGNNVDMLMLVSVEPTT